ncbi:MAG: chemotaxis-specific protein-glutamate methyltransferase CheB [Planctomycetaceae bacterium]
METPEPIRILIVDDSRIFRGMLQAVLEQIPGVQVVGSVFSGEKALEFIARSPPDLITLDIEMPGISGLETLREIAKRNVQAKPLAPVDTILVSALTKKGAMVTVEGLLLGALDFLCKPSEPSEQANRDLLRRSIEQKLVVVRRRRVDQQRRAGSGRMQRSGAGTAGVRGTNGQYRAIAIGTSTGGPEALGILLPALTRQCNVPILIVQHILEGLSSYLAESLSRKCGRPVVEARDDLVVQPGMICLAKSGRHMVVRSQDGVIRIGLSDAPPEKGCRPAVNVFLRSAAVVYGSRLAATILTGMGDDGAEGVRAVKRVGGYVIAQDEASSVVWGMPRAAAETGAVDEVLPLSKIAVGAPR